MDGRYGEVTTWEPFETAKNCWEEDSEPGRKAGWSSWKDYEGIHTQKGRKKVSEEEKNTTDKPKGPIF